METSAKDLSIVLSGEAGQGLKTLELLLLKIAKRQGYRAFAYGEFMSRIRGGNNTTLIRIGRSACNAFVKRIDVAVSLQKDGLRRIQPRIGERTVVLVDEGDDAPGFAVPFSRIALESGGKVFLNTAVLGTLCALLGLDPAAAAEILRDNLKKLDEEKIGKNIAAFGRGFEEGSKIRPQAALPPLVRSEEPLDRFQLMSGSDAVGIGALAGGCNFIASYPMSPSTSVLEFLAKQAGPFGVAVEQAEDEIAAVNMAIGSWYAGGRAMVSTSGGGFALMEEGVSLAGCMESPLVVHLAQRPGPATGLPTRTEQGDLNLALYAGHGEFPRAIYAPALTEDGVALTVRAFSTADKFQIPVFILTDQYFLDSCATVPEIDLDPDGFRPHIVTTDGAYKRYAFTGDGVSPRGIPGFGDGLVCADSDEHDEAGYITEDFAMRTRMVDKRNKKLEALEREALPPRFFGADDFTTLLVGWGSTLEVLREALQASGRADVALLHFSQVFPVAKNARAVLERARVRVIVENNATAQFGALLTAATGCAFHKKILQYDGMPFSVEGLAEAIRGL
jgi:2-oxoglutarate/2-oxoacid ferredoxin oxidoreductase subunit alpha